MRPVPGGCGAEPLLSVPGSATFKLSVDGGQITATITRLSYHCIQHRRDTIKVFSIAGYDLLTLGVACLLCILSGRQVFTSVSRVRLFDILDLTVSCD